MNTLFKEQNTFFLSLSVFCFVFSPAVFIVKTKIDHVRCPKTRGIYAASRVAKYVAFFFVAVKTRVVYLFICLLVCFIVRNDPNCTRITSAAQVCGYLPASIVWRTDQEAIRKGSGFSGRPKATLRHHARAGRLDFVKLGLHALWRQCH